MVIPLVANNQAAIAALCQRYGVSKLDVFGSAATGAFDPATSDLDLVVTFADYGPGIAARFIDFADALEALVGRKVDLVFDSKMKNPYFRASVNETRQVVYQTRDQAHRGSAPNRRLSLGANAAKSPSPAHRERGWGEGPP